jgi:predicted nucleic-acid-binding protein
MIGVDTNVLVRYIMRDVPTQTRLATQFFRALTREEPAFVSAVVLAETTWVLGKTYKAARAELAAALEAVLSADSLVVEHRTCAHRALAALRGGADFADAFIAEIDRHAGCDETVTFDKSAVNRAGMRLLN